MDIEYAENGDVAYFNGMKFRRDKHTGYFLNSAQHKRLHRCVWEYYNGEIPDGYHIHHIDENKDNNDIGNLECITAYDHRSLHGHERAEREYDKMIENLQVNAVPKAAEWHKSAEGRQWHKDHWKETVGKTPLKDYVCQNCGKPFKSKMYAAKYCCRTCATAARRKSGVDNEVRKCAWCGAEYTINKYYKHQYCSPECANLGRLAKRQMANI